MQEFRRFVRGPVGKVLLAAIILPFIISGFYGYFTGGGDSVSVAEVDGNKIYRNYVTARTERLRQMLRQQSPGVSEAMLDAYVRPEMVLEGIINEQLTLSAANSADMVFSEVQAAAEIRSNQAFFENGKFSDEQFERLLRSQGMTPRGYLDGYRQDRLTQQYRFAFTGTDFALPGELAEQRRLGEQTRDLRYVQLSLADLESQFNATDEQVAQYYQDHQDQFMRPERYRISYLVLSPEQYEAQVDVSDDDIRAEYEARRSMAESRANGSKEVAHILIGTDERSADEALERAREVREAIEGGESFADAAKTYSDDPGSADNGGNLGMLAPGSLPEALDEALKSLSVGDVSEPVVSESGVHLLTVLREDKQTFPPLDEMREGLIADLKAARAQSMMMDALAQMEELVFEHGDLQTPAEQLGLKVETTDWVAVNDLPAELDSPKVREALNTPAVKEQGHNSDVLELDGGRYLAVHLEDRQEPEPLPLDQVADRIRDTLKGQQAREKALSLAEQARELAKEGKALDEIAALANARIEEQSEVHRGARQPAPMVVQQAFTLPWTREQGASEIQVADLPNGGWVAFQVTGVTDGGQEPLPESQQKQALLQLGEMEGERDFEQVMAFLRDTRDVTIHADELRAKPE
ncbi:SurA N-terminal domain-containing protein [Alloalcanivorax xenomutans]|uniref:SurA N-terminal domain-containing protein n=1 Tax=Alloalcanivorax xenomutans TaxID=1094342 RepID=UPI003BA88A0A